MFCCYFLEVCSFLTRPKKGLDLVVRGGREEQGGDELAGPRPCGAHLLSNSQRASSHSILDLESVEISIQCRKKLTIVRPKD